MQDEEEADPLDAFMATEVLPEVTAAQEAERAMKEKERLEKAAQRAVRTFQSDVLLLIGPATSLIQKRKEEAPQEGRPVRCVPPLLQASQRHPSVCARAASHRLQLAWVAEVVSAADWKLKATLCRQGTLGKLELCAMRRRARSRSCRRF